MLRLADFYHLPDLDEILAQLVADRPGLIVVAGLDPRPGSAAALLPSGRATIFRVLLGELLDASPRARAIVVAQERNAVRTRGSFGRRVALTLAEPPTYAEHIRASAARRPDLLVVDRLSAETVAPVVAAVRDGLRVLTQLDTVFRGAAVMRHLLDLGAPSELADMPAWVVAVQRLPMLCAHCRSVLDELPAPLPGWWSSDARLFYRAVGCQVCGGSGRSGDIAAFDVFRTPPLARTGARPASAVNDGVPAAAARLLPPIPSGIDEASLLSLETYALRLAQEGYLAYDDLIALGDDQLRRTYRLFAASEEALTRANAALERKLVELESANRVLQQRTAALMSLQDLGSALIGSATSAELFGRVCRHARELCGADRAILYLRRGDEAEVLAVSGWPHELVHTCLPAAEVFDEGEAASPRPSTTWPPGVPRRHPDVDGGRLRAGLRVPLVAQREHVGLMLVHTTLKSRFSPGEVALISSFANQAALSIQRAELVEQLRQKIAQLEEAQAALVAKERLEREMELARDVQQSVLPRVFPEVPGFAFAARNEPARQVGGDFYDIFRLDETRFGAVIADVSGKGMPAALYMALARSLLLAEARREPSPRAALCSVNRLLRELGEPHMFVTVFYAVVDSASRTLTYARAGHDYPVLLRGGEPRTLDADGTVLGFFPEQELFLDEACVALAPGDRLVLYTDGLTDAMDAAGRRYELGRLLDLLLAHASLGAAALVEATLGALSAYQGPAPQYDDMTMLVVEVTA